MSKALEAAQKAIFTSQYNPRVGCVIVENDQIVGTGYTQAPGSNHAEIQAIHDAQQQRANLRNCHIYVTLEPCSHYGKTPPCVKTIIDVQPQSVTMATLDPNPLVKGKGFEALKNAGIRVQSGIEAPKAIELNIGFFKRMLTQKPWVRAKIATSLDGKYCLENGASKWITGEYARLDGHRLRARSNLIVTGVQTILSDNPSLNVRLPDIPASYQQPDIMVLDTQAKTPVNSAIFNNSSKIWIVHGDQCKALPSFNHNTETLPMPQTSVGIDLQALFAFIEQLNHNEIHIESGGRLISQLLTLDLIDELVLYVAPMIFGSGRSWATLSPISSITATIPLQFHSQALFPRDNGSFDTKLIYHTSSCLPELFKPLVELKI